MPVRRLDGEEKKEQFQQSNPEMQRCEHQALLKGSGRSSTGLVGS